MNKRVGTDVVLHDIMSLTGGFLGTYAILSRSGIFASAQTGNVMRMVMALFDGDSFDLAARMGALVMFALALSASWLMKYYTSFSMEKLCLLVDAVGLTVTALLPQKMNPLLALYPLFIAASFQWGTYSGAGGYNSASTFSTNNLKQCVWGWTEYAVTREEKAKEKAVFYTITVSMFLAGAYIGCAAVYLFGTFGAFVGMLPLAAAYLVIRNRGDEKI